MFEISSPVRHGLMTSVAVIAALATLLVAAAGVGAADDREARADLSRDAEVAGSIVIGVIPQHYVTLWVLGCLPEGGCYPQGWADFFISDGQTTLAAISQANGGIVNVGPFLGSTITVTQGLHATGDAPRVRCGQVFTDPATGAEIQPANEDWQDLPIENGSFTYEGLAGSSLVCYIDTGTGGT